MAVNPMLSSGVNGIQTGLNGLQNVAHEIAAFNTTTNPTDADAQVAPVSGPGLDEIAESIVDLKVYQRQVEASVKVVQTADEVIGFLLDVHA